MKKIFLLGAMVCALGMMTANAQTRMYPVTKVSLQETNFDKLLSCGFNIDTAYKFVYYVWPSFTAEYCMTYDSKTKSLLLCKSKSKVGYSLTGKETKKARKKRLETYLLPVDDAFVDSLQSMFTAIINSASPDSQRSGLDGISYYFFMPTDINTVVSAWVPIDKSNCGRAVDIMERLCVAIEKKDNAATEQLREEIVALTAVFRALPAVYYVH